LSACQIPLRSGRVWAVPMDAAITVNS